MLFELFYPVDEHEEPLKVEHLSDELREVCRTCPTRNDCVADSLRQPDDMNYGFRANTTRRERERIRTEHAKLGVIFAPEERRTGSGRISLAAEAFILDRARNGWGPYKIARALDESGYQTPSGNPWDRDTVKDLLVRRGLYTPQADRQDAADVRADLHRVQRIADAALRRDPLAILEELEPPIERTIAEEMASAADCMASCSLEELRALELEG